MIILFQRSKKFLFLTSALVGSPLLAQQAAPVTVTPPTLRPDRTDNGFRVDIPESGGLTAPAGAEGLSVALADAKLEGGFQEVADQTEAILAKLRGQKVTLKQIYAAASEIEAVHARAGFILARVAVPPQDLRDGGSLRITVTDGFVESVDVAGVPVRVRAAVAARAAKLAGQKHLRLADIEQPLLIANEVPGLTLKSTLARGSQPGGTKVVLEGSHHLVSGSIGGDNQLASSLGRWNVTAQLSLNSAFGLGEQIYGFVGSGYDVSQIFGSDVRERVLGGGVVLPIGDGRLTLNPEVTFSRTQPAPALGTPATLGTLRRYTLRAGYTLVKTRVQSLALNAAVEQIDERNGVPSFGTQGNLSHDRFLAARLGVAYDRVTPSGSAFGVAAQFSQGLGDSVGLSLAAAIAETSPNGGFSRQGASNSFSKFTAQAHGSMDFAKNLTLRVMAKGQTGFGTPMLRAEQFSLEGSDGVSAYVGGVTAVDDGVAARAELAGRVALGDAKSGAIAAPYIFVASGFGIIQKATTLEPGSIKAAAFGVGARANLPRFGFSLGLEYAHGVSDYVAIDKADRVNLSASFRF